MPSTSRTRLMISTSRAQPRHARSARAGFDVKPDSRLRRRDRGVIRYRRGIRVRATWSITITSPGRDVRIAGPTAAGWRACSPERSPACPADPIPDRDPHKGATAIPTATGLARTDSAQLQPCSFPDRRDRMHLVGVVAGPVAVWPRRAHGHRHTGGGGHLPKPSGSFAHRI